MSVDISGFAASPVLGLHFLVVFTPRAGEAAHSMSERA
jgi:hypothetical protein